MTVTKLYEKALHRVQHSPSLAPHEETIMAGWGGNGCTDVEHYCWVVIGPIADIHEWAEAVEAAAE